MNRLNLIEMARKAISEEPYAEVALPSQNTVWMMGIVQLEKFAALIAAHEREACAKLVEPDEEHRRDAIWGYIGGEEGVELLDIKAAAIRARSKHES